jgi:dTDP-4-dehydrorhamnose 3,5-epimerase-like enzyme
MSEGQNKTPRLIDGGLAVDDRGQVSFVNDFGFAGVRRFYMVANHCQGFVRAWHAHRREAKYVFVTSGAAIVGAVEIDDWEKPSKTAHVHRHVLSANKPSILYIPAGYANGFKSLANDTTIIFFSTASMEEARNDDVRYDARYWDIWEIIER